MIRLSVGPRKVKSMSPATEGWMLYNLKKDPYELKNLVRGRISDPLQKIIDEIDDFAQTEILKGIKFGSSKRKKIWKSLKINIMTELLEDSYCGCKVQRRLGFIFEIKKSNFIFHSMEFILFK